MAAPTPLDAALGTTTTPAPTAGRGGGTPLDAALTTGSVPPSTAGADGLAKVVVGGQPHHGGGGLLHTIAHGAGDALDTVENVTKSLVTGGYDIGKAAVDPGTHPSWAKLWHEWNQPLTSAFSHENIASDPLATDVTAIGKQTLTSVEHPLRDPIQTVITGLMIASAGLSGAAKVAYVTKALDAAKIESTGKLVLLGSDAAKAAIDAGETVTPLTTGEKVSLITKTLSPVARVPRGERILKVPKVFATTTPAKDLKVGDVLYDKTDTPYLTVGKIEHATDGGVPVIVLHDAKGGYQVAVEPHDELKTVPGSGLTHEPVQLATSHSSLGWAFGKGHDAIVQKALDSNITGDQGVVAKYGYKRVAKAIAEQERIAQNTRAVLERQIHYAYKLYDKGISRNVGELASWLRSANVTPEEAVNFWTKEGQPQLASIAQELHNSGALVMDHAGNLQVDAAKFPGLAKADELLSQGQHLREGVITEHGLMDPAKQAERLNLVGKVMAGGKDVKPTPGRLGRPPEALLRHRSYTARLGKLHERALAKAQKGELSRSQAKMAGDIVPATDREFEVQDQLDAINKALTEARKHLPEDSPEVQELVREKTAWQKVGIARTDMEAAASHVEGATVPSPEEIDSRIEDLRAQIKSLRDERDPGLLKQIRALERQADALRKERKRLNIGSRQLHSGLVLTDRGARLEPKHYARAERLGAALSVARDKLEQMEATYQNRIEPTGIVGRNGIAHAQGQVDKLRASVARATPGSKNYNRLTEKLRLAEEVLAERQAAGESRPGQAYISLATSTKKARQSPVARSPGPIIPAVKRMSLAKRATGGGIAKGLVTMQTTASVARSVRDALRFVNSKELRGAVAKFGSDTRRTADDILIRDPALEKGATKVSDHIQQLLGQAESTLTEPEQETLRSALENIVRQAIPGLEDKFAADRAAEIGTRAPEGFKWVPRSILPDTLTTGVTARGGVEQFADALNSGVTSATVYFKLGHLPTRFLTNLSTNVMQGSVSPGEFMRSARMAHELSDDTKQVLTAATGTHGFLALPHEGTGALARAAARGAGWWARRIDAPFRLNSILYEFRQVGIDTPEAITKAAEQLRDPTRGGMSGSEISKLDGAVRRANRAAIMYDGLSAAEKRYVARYVWFFPWTKGAVRFAGHSLINHPVKSAALYAIGKQGAAARQAGLGDVPGFEENLTPLTGGNTPLTANFSSFTPFSTTGDIAGLIRHPFNTDSGIASQLNPVSGAVVDLGHGDLKAAEHEFTSPPPEFQVGYAKKPSATQMFLPTNVGLGSQSHLSAYASALVHGLGGPAVPRPTRKAVLNRSAHRKTRTIYTYGP